MQTKSNNYYRWFLLLEGSAAPLLLPVLYESLGESLELSEDPCVPDPYKRPSELWWNEAILIASSCFLLAFHSFCNHSTFKRSASHSCIRMNGSLPLMDNICQGFGLGSHSLTEPWGSLVDGFSKNLYLEPKNKGPESFPYMNSLTKTIKALWSEFVHAVSKHLLEASFYRVAFWKKRILVSEWKSVWVGFTSTSVEQGRCVHIIHDPNVIMTQICSWRSILWRRGWLLFAHVMRSRVVGGMKPFCRQRWGWSQDTSLQWSSPLVNNLIS